jgi:TonB family protein
MSGRLITAIPTTLAVLLLWGNVADASCEPAILKPTTLQALTEDGLKERQEFFARMCSFGDGELVDSSDTSLIGRLTQPSKATFPKNKEYYPEIAIQQGASGTAIVAYIVETNGSVKQAELLETSGNLAIDAAALQFVHDLKFANPGLLDGHPVRVFMSVPQRFNIKH